MQETTEHGLVPTEGQLDGLGSIVCDRISLIEHVRGSIAAIAREQTCSNPEDAADVMVLDDVTPRYAKASVALNACRASLRTALHVLADNRRSARRSMRLG